MLKPSVIALLLLCLAVGPAIADRFALLDAQGNVVNIIEADPSFVPDDGLQMQADDGSARVGGTFANGVFTPPPRAAVAKAPLDFLSFMALFNADEQSAIVNSADTQVKLFLLMATGAKSIDPRDPRTAQGLDLLAAKGLITADRETAIKTAMGPQ